jgi:hypothetical protein
MAFKEFLKTRSITDNPRGDFIKNALSDSRLPDAQTWSVLDMYLSRKATRDTREIVVKTARKLWLDYQKHIAK